MTVKSVHVEFTDRKHVLVIHTVDQEVLESGCNDIFVTFLHIKLQQEHSAAESCQQSEENDNEVADIVDCLNDQFDIE